jgi:hypothetical protein
MSGRVTLALPAVVLLALALAGCAEQPTAPSQEPAQPQLLAAQAALLPGCYDGTESSGALYRICVPQTWNGDAVVWAHGYVPPTEPVAIPVDSIQGVPIWLLVNALNYVYATTSDASNGLAGAHAVADLTELKGLVGSMVGQPRYTYLLGVSEGGLSTTLALEQSQTFSGGLAACAPIGSFARQINYVGDFRVVFDYFFPGIMPGSAVLIPVSEMDQTKWDNYYDPTIRAALAANPHAAEQLIRVTGAAIDASDPTSVAETALHLLWFSVFATDDARARLGGNPFDNHLRQYSGSDDDVALNAGVARYSAAPAAVTAMQAYETSGQLKVPAVMIHTSLDPLVPYGHEQLYALKSLTAGTWDKLLILPQQSYGHCAFDVWHMLGGFAVLVLRVSGGNLLASSDVFPSSAAQRQFLNFAETGGARPRIIRRSKP